MRERSSAAGLLVAVALAGLAVGTGVWGATLSGAGRWSLAGLGVLLVLVASVVGGLAVDEFHDALSTSSRARFFTVLTTSLLVTAVIAPVAATLTDDPDLRVLGWLAVPFLLFIGCCSLGAAIRAHRDAGVLAANRRARAPR